VADLFVFTDFEHVVLDVFDLAGLDQTALGLEVGVFAGAYVDEHEALAVPAQTVAHLLGQFVVALGDHGVPIRQFLHDVLQTREALVDGARLLQHLQGGARALLPLTPRQVDQIQLAE